MTDEQPESWTLDESTREPFILVKYGVSLHVACETFATLRYTCEREPERMLPRLRMMAAAPDLVKALSEYVGADNAVYGEGHTERSQRGIAALKKARGEK